MSGGQVSKRFQRSKEGVWGPQATSRCCSRPRAFVFLPGFSLPAPIKTYWPGLGQTHSSFTLPLGRQARKLLSPSRWTESTMILKGKIYFSHLRKSHLVLEADPSLCSRKTLKNLNTTQFDRLKLGLKFLKFLPAWWAVRSHFSPLDVAAGAGGGPRPARLLPET